MVIVHGTDRNEIFWDIICRFIIIILFLQIHVKKRRGKIRTNNFHFMKYDQQLIMLLFKN